MVSNPMRKNISIYEETYRLLEELSKVFRKAGFRYSKAYIIDICVKLTASLVLGYKTPDVSLVMKKLKE